VTIDVGECAAIEKPDARLACLEAQIEAARQAPAAPAAPAPAARQAPVAPAPVAPAPVAPAPVVRAAPAAPAPAARPSPPAEPSSKAAVEAPPPARQRSDEKSARAERDSEQQAEIVAKVVELRETVPNAFLITLDNGQVWRQASPEPYPLRTGLEVRLRPGKWGTAYRLTAPELRGQIQVKRER
jgi:hypothetical protein